jgi:hypothetical protein
MDADIFLWSHGELTATETVGMMDYLRSTRINKNPSQAPLLLEILRDSRRFKCTLPSDKIYGVLGLASDSSFSIDYTLSASEVYKRFAMSYLRDRSSLDTLYCCAKSPRQSKLTLPSWVTDWTQPCYHEPFRLRNYPSKATGDSQPKLAISNDTNTLSILGKSLDTIAAIEHIRRIPRNTSPFYKEGLGFWASRHEAWANDIAAHTRAWFANIPKIAFPDGLCTPQSYEALWRTFVCNKTADNEPPPEEWSQKFADFLTSTALPHEEFLGELRREQRAPNYDLRRVGGEDPFLGWWKRLTPYRKAYGAWCYNRRFFRSEEGRFGWAPGEAKVGDEVCILYGGDVPFVLRGNGEGGHEVIGDAYLHGFMDGEGMECRIEEKEFHLV